MIIKMVWLYIFLQIIIFWACAPKPALVAPERAKEPETKASTVTQEGWEIEWERVKKEAKKEGRVVLFTTAGAELRQAFSEGLKEYGLELQIIAGRGTELVERILRERRAGIYGVDLYMGGYADHVRTLKPAGALTSIEPLLLLPEVKDPRLWYKGRLNFADKDKLTIAFIAYMDHGIHINTEQVKPGDINSMSDLLSPRWKGKIIMDDPTVSGRGQQWLSVVSMRLGEEYIRQLAKQDPLMTRDLRQTIDWVAKGRYSIGLGVRPTEYQEYKRAGAPVTNLVLKEASYLLGGIGFASYLDRAPNPKAAAIFLNWLLSKKGQTIWVEIRMDQSARIDMPLDHLEKAGMPIRMEGVDYFDTRNEEWELGEDKQKAVDLLRQVFAPMLR